MSDVRLVQNTNFPFQSTVTMDWLLLPTGMLDEEQALATAVIVALGTDRRALPDDQLPGLEQDEDRRGWWGDFDAEEIWGGWPIGTRLWLLKRSSIVGAGSKLGSTLARADNYLKEAIQPFVDRKIASGFSIALERNGPYRIDALVTIYRGPKRAVELRFENLWDEQLK